MYYLPIEKSYINIFSVVHIFLGVYYIFFFVLYFDQIDTTIFISKINIATFALNLLITASNLSLILTFVTESRFIKHLNTLVNFVSAVYYATIKLSKTKNDLMYIVTFQLFMWTCTMCILLFWTLLDTIFTQRHLYMYVNTSIVDAEKKAMIRHYSEDYM